MANPVDERAPAPLSERDPFLNPVDPANAGTPATPKPLDPRILALFPDWDEGDFRDNFGPAALEAILAFLIKYAPNGTYATWTDQDDLALMPVAVAILLDFDLKTGKFDPPPRFGNIESDSIALAGEMSLCVYRLEEPVPAWVFELSDPEEPTVYFV